MISHVVAYIGKVRIEMSEIKFSDGMPVRERRSSTSIYPEELLDKKMRWLCKMPAKRKEWRNRISLYNTAVHQRHFTRRQSLCYLLGQRRGREVQSVKGTGRREPQERTLEYLFKARADQTHYRK